MAKEVVFVFGRDSVVVLVLLLERDEGGEIIDTFNGGIDDGY